MKNKTQKNLVKAASLGLSAMLTFAPAMNVLASDAENPTPNGGNDNEDEKDAVDVEAMKSLAADAADSAEEAAEIVEALGDKIDAIDATVVTEAVESVTESMDEVGLEDIDAIADAYDEVEEISDQAVTAAAQAEAVIGTISVETKNVEDAVAKANDDIAKAGTIAEVDQAVVEAEEVVNAAIDNVAAQQAALETATDNYNAALEAMEAAQAAFDAAVIAGQDDLAYAQSALEDAMAEVDACELELDGIKAAIMEEFHNAKDAAKVIDDAIKAVGNKKNGNNNNNGNGNNNNKGNGNNKKEVAGAVDNLFCAVVDNYYIPQIIKKQTNEEGSAVAQVTTSDKLVKFSGDGTDVRDYYLVHVVYEDNTEKDIYLDYAFDDNGEMLFFEKNLGYYDATNKAQYGLDDANIIQVEDAEYHFDDATKTTNEIKLEENQKLVEEGDKTTKYVVNTENGTIEKAVVGDITVATTTNVTLGDTPFEVADGADAEEIAKELAEKAAEAQLGENEEITDVTVEVTNDSVYEATGTYKTTFSLTVDLTGAGIKSTDLSGKVSAALGDEFKIGACDVVGTYEATETIKKGNGKKEQTVSYEAVKTATFTFTLASQDGIITVTADDYNQPLSNLVNSGKLKKAKDYVEENYGTGIDVKSVYSEDGVVKIACNGSIQNETATGKTEEEAKKEALKNAQQTSEDLLDSKINSILASLNATQVSSSVTVNTLKDTVKEVASGYSYTANVTKVTTTVEEFTYETTNYTGVTSVEKTWVNTEFEANREANTLLTTSDAVTKTSDLAHKKNEAWKPYEEAATNLENAKKALEDAQANVKAIQDEIAGLTAQGGVYSELVADYNKALIDFNKANGEYEKAVSDFNEAAAQLEDVKDNAANRKRDLTPKNNNNNNDSKKDNSDSRENRNVVPTAPIVNNDNVVAPIPSPAEFVDEIIPTPVEEDDVDGGNNNINNDNNNIGNNNIGGNNVVADIDEAVEDLVEIPEEEVPLAVVEAPEVIEEEIAQAEDLITIGDEETPLAAIMDEETTKKVAWWWLIILAICSATGFTVYQVNKKSTEKNGKRSNKRN